MSLAFYLDEHVPVAIATGLRTRGVDVLTVAEDARSGASDEQLLERATSLARVLFTHDTDFLLLGADWLKTGKPFHGLIYAHQLHVTIGQAIRDLELMARVLDPDDLQNRIEFIPIA